MTALVVPEKNKLSRRKKARAKKTLHKAIFKVMSEIDGDPFLRSHLFLNKPAKNKIVVGGYIVTKEDDHLYNVYKKNMQNLMHESLYSFDAAMAIAESLNAGRNQQVKRIVELEQEYAKHYNDLMIYKNRYNALKRGDQDTWIYEDRYIISSVRARNVLKEIKRFRIAGK